MEWSAGRQGPKLRSGRNERIAEAREARATLHQTIPVVMTDLVAEVAKQGAIGLVQVDALSGLDAGSPALRCPATVSLDPACSGPPTVPAAAASPQARACRVRHRSHA